MAAPSDHVALSVLPLVCLVFLISLQTSQVADAHGISYINKICERASRFNPAIKMDFCVTSLQAVPESYNTEIGGLLQITTGLALQNASRTSHLIQKLGSVTCADMTKKELDNCLKAYNEAVSDLQEIAQAYAANQYDVETKLGWAQGAALQCDKGFEYHGSTNLLAEENNNFRQLVTLVQALHSFATKHMKH